MRSASALDWVRGFADDIASNRDDAPKDVRDERYKELACMAYWAGCADAVHLNGRDRADEIEYGSPEHINGLSRFALEAEFRWLLGRCRELEAECVRLSEAHLTERGKCSMYYGEDDDGVDSFWCSECGCRQAATFEHTEAGNLIERHIIEPRYCPFCGREVSE